MPRKPTFIAREARARIIEMVQEMDAKAPLPTLQVLSDDLDLHPSTIFRILRDLAAEGIVWQAPSGRFHPAAARKSHVRGAPVCFIGRELWQWSKLYQEILDGVSEICSANGSPLVLLPAPSLVKQAEPMQQPLFATAKVQRKEIARLAPLVPKNCGGILLDHLWCEPALRLLGNTATPKVQLIHGASSQIPVAGPDTARAARSVREFLGSRRIDEVHLVIPFTGDCAIDGALGELRAALEDMTVHEVTFQEIDGKLAEMLARPRRRCGLVCAEDNTALALSSQLARLNLKDDRVVLLTTQGTGALSAPASRLRFDYRRLGRAAASNLLRGTPIPAIHASLIWPQGQIR